MPKAKTKAENDADFLQQYIGETYRDDPKTRALLEEQGIDFSEYDKRQAEDDSTNDASTDDLNNAVDELDTTDKQRIDKDKQKKVDPNSPEAIKQRVQDALKVSQSQALNAGRQTASSVRDKTFSIADKVGTFPTPTGMASLIIILVILLLAILPVNGQPRIIWLWLVLVRHAHLRPEGEAATAAQQSNSQINDLATAAETAIQNVQSNPAVQAVEQGIGQGISVDIPIIPSVGSLLPGLNRYIHG